MSGHHKDTNITTTTGSNNTNTNTNNNNGSGMQTQVYVVLKGFLVSIRGPSASVLEIAVNADKLSKQELDDLRDELNYTIQRIETKYTGEQTNRTIRILWNEKEERLMMPDGSLKSVKKRIATIVFTPFPSTIVNTIQSIRLRAYHMLEKYGEAAQRMQFGNTTRTFYILPYTTAPQFFAAVKELNEELARIREEVRKFITESGDMDVILDILEKYRDKITCDMSKMIRIASSGEGISNIIVQATPLVLDPRKTIELIDDVMAHIQDGNRSKKEIESLREALVSSIEESRKSMVETILNSLRERIEKTVSAVQNMVKHPKYAVAHVKTLEDIIKGLNLYTEEDGDSRSKLIKSTLNILYEIARQPTHNDRNQLEIKKKMFKSYFTTDDPKAIADIIMNRLLGVPE